MTSFADAIRLRHVEDGDCSARFEVDVPADWSQGRTAFGGLGAAMLIRAVEELPGLAQVPIRSVDTAFVGPLCPGVATITAEVLRHGKYLTHARAEVASAGQGLAATAHVVLGAPRPSQVSVAGPVAQPVPIDDCIPMPYLEGVTPEFTRNMELRFASGFPFSGSGSASMAGYCRHREPVTGVAALAGLVDAWPPAVTPTLPGPAPASSVRWSVHLPGDAAIQGDAWHWYAARTVVAGGGQATTTAGLWRDGDLVAWSEQLVAVFDKPRG